MDYFARQKINKLNISSLIRVEDIYLQEFHKMFTTLLALNEFLSYICINHLGCFPQSILNSSSRGLTPAPLLNLTGMIRPFLMALSLAMVCCYSFNARAQFANAVIPSYGYNISPIFSSQTDNDIQDISGVTYEVAVTDDQANNWFFGWRVGGSIGNLTLGPAAVINKPSVALIKNNGNTVYAVVVYFNPMVNEIRRQTFVWNASQQQFNYWSELLLAPADVYSSLRIASDDNGFFAIVWDEPGQQVKLMTGQALSAAPVMMNGGQVFDLESGEQPDVCIYRRASDNYRQVMVAFINQAASISVDSYDYSDLSVGALNPNHLYRTQVPDLMYRNPRIACPGSVFIAENNFTLVTEDTDDNSTWYIKGFRVVVVAGSVFAKYHIYNDGDTGNSPWNITTVPNTGPVVAYNTTADDVWVSWEVDNSWGLLNANGAVMGRYPVAMSLFRDASIFPGSKYLYVPNSVTLFSDASAVSVAGNKSSKALFTYCDNNSHEMLSKTVTHQSNAPNLRIIPFAGSNLNEWLSLVQQQPSSVGTQIAITWFDLTGRIVMEFFGSAFAADAFVKDSNGKIASGVYMVKAVASNPSIPAYTGKYIKHSKE